MREDLVGSVPRALAPALPPELLELFQQGPRGAEEQGVLLRNGVVQGRVIAVTAQPARERPLSPASRPKSLSPGRTEHQAPEATYTRAPATSGGTGPNVSFPWPQRGQSSLRAQAQLRPIPWSKVKELRER